MKEASKMSVQMTCQDLLNVIGLQELQSGPIPSASQDGLTIARSGLAPARASLSARQAKEMGLLTSGTFGLTSSTSSASADLSMYLANRLQAVTQTHGSTLYKQTWKEWDTPSGLCRLRQRASVRRTSENGPIGWPTPTASSVTGAGTSGRQGGMNIQSAVMLAGWQTPVANDATGSTHCYSGKDQDGTPNVCLKLPGTVLLTGWPTPRAVDGEKGSRTLQGCESEMQRKGRLDDLPSMAAWTMSSGPLRLTVFGEMRTGSYVEMVNGVQLNPAHSRWLMGLPHAWDESSPGWQEWQAATASADSKATATP